MKKYIGKVDHVSINHAYVILEKQNVEDVFVATKHLQGALHQDKVQIVLLPHRTHKNTLQGKVVEIIERHNNNIVGRLTIAGERGYCIPDHKRLYRILVPMGLMQSAKDNDKVIVNITDWSKSEEKPIGKVVDILGRNGDHTTETQALLAQFQVEKAFQPEVESFVADIPSELSTQAIAARRDFRKVKTFTIDPVDAKDFDDALSIQLLPNGNYEVGIHIADVTHYVKENTRLDQEALKRSTSVYPVGMVVPMLPERLANELCSLQPQQIRPAFSAVVTLTKEAAVKNIWMGETVIFSDKRFTYKEANDVILQKKGKYYPELNWLYQLSQALRRKRMKEGAIAFESTDVQIELNENNKPIDIKPKKSIAANHLIEEFMLLANRLVAEKIARHCKKTAQGTFIYRVHPPPTREKIAQFALFVKHLGYEFNSDSDAIAHSFNELLQKVKGAPHQAVVQNFAMRTMEQAYYTTASQGHFGLGFKYYTHFTSPIRRYSDIIVHRLLKNYLKNSSLSKKTSEAVARHISERERIAIATERAFMNYYQVLFMQKMEGKIFEGIISGITQRGIYVEVIQNKCAGMIRLADLKDDYYIFNKNRFRLQGRHHKRIYQLGDPITIQVKHCDIDRKTIDFVPVH